MQEDNIREALLITQEECAEVTQIISKCLRFGFMNKHPVTGEINYERLEEELGDVLAMIDVLFKYDVVSKAVIDLHKAKKMEKLAKWSNVL